MTKRATLKNLSKLSPETKIKTNATHFVKKSGWRFESQAAYISELDFVETVGDLLAVKANSKTKLKSYFGLAIWFEVV